MPQDPTNITENVFLKNHLISIQGPADFDNGLQQKFETSDGDLYIAAVPKPDDPQYRFEIQSFRYDTLLSNALSAIFNREVTDVESIWQFTKNYNTAAATVRIPSNVVEQEISDIPDTVFSNTAINIDTFKRFFESRVDELSAMLYDENSDKRKLPSTPGDIITSSTLSSLAAVQKIYGTDTNWKIITERSIIGKGRLAANSNTNTRFGGQIPAYYLIGETLENTLGGENSVQLKNHQIPQHFHKFVTETERVTFDIRVSFINEPRFGDNIVTGNWGIFGRRTRNPGTGVQGIKWTWCTGHDDYWLVNPGGQMFAYADSGTPPGGAFGRHMWRAGTIGGLVSTWNMYVILSTHGLLGTNKLSKDIYEYSTGINVSSKNKRILGLQQTKTTTTTDSETSALPHNNLPPFVTKYIWKRIS